MRNSVYRVSTARGGAKVRLPLVSASMVSAVKDGLRTHPPSPNTTSSPWLHTHAVTSYVPEPTTSTLYSFYSSFHTACPPPQTSTRESVTLIAVFLQLIMQAEV